MPQTTEPKNNLPPLHTYTIAYITALPKEQTAVLATLDTIHHQHIPTPVSDKNTYTLGSIPPHNIVLICLPTMGTTSAASAVTSLLHMFPSIRFALLVGVAGGVPSNGVKLGDVVVSVPVSGGYGGVAGWDRGMLVRNGRVVVQNEGGMCRREEFGVGLGVKKVLERLKRNSEMVARKINGCLDDVEERFPRLVSRWTRCDGLRDPLLERWWVYSYLYLLVWVLWKVVVAGVVGLLGLWGLEMMGVGFGFEGDVGKEKMMIAGEKKRRNVRVHYGLIASGNFVVKDAKARDALNKGFEEGILCAEMEAAGVMDLVPCIVVRGICDYADSGKNKDWQEYAAMVAAAYARVLLESLSPGDVEMVGNARNEHPGYPDELDLGIRI
ncbi:ankyrin repeat-containing protein [Aspergillus costaricaensis CBS 115574]|uniref:Ankyrin repeat-containing protein n=1 Tax=Aspergillus costaricaensis CBS 115574 TaxID=1448317 RepID=A0ACD1IKJ7_9EURO|nr:ankyrin repeat-containing protein [Aspergillus costaricaensis CBS 115574]RAK91106.1 ankyrin repeat-containing protein [Aspergillus costaricaensis CBS 115574]